MFSATQVSEVYAKAGTFSLGTCSQKSMVKNQEHVWKCAHDSKMCSVGLFYLLKGVFFWFVYFLQLVFA